MIGIIYRRCVSDAIHEKQQKKTMKIRLNYEHLDLISDRLRGVMDVDNGREFGVYLSYVLRVPYRCIGASIRMNSSIQEMFKYRSRS